MICMLKYYKVWYREKEERKAKCKKFACCFVLGLMMIRKLVEKFNGAKRGEEDVGTGDEEVK